MSPDLTPPTNIPQLPEIIVSNPAWSCEVLETPEAALEIKSTPGTLRVWRTQGTGPVFLKIGAKVLYVRRDLYAWLFARGKQQRTRTAA